MEQADEKPENGEHPKVYAAFVPAVEGHLAIHAPEPRNRLHGEEDEGDDREPLHDLVHLVALPRHVEVDERDEEVLRALQDPVELLRVALQPQKIFEGMEHMLGNARAELALIFGLYGF